MKTPLLHRLQQGGIILKEQYPIYLTEKKVGEACLEKKGMFWHITLRCSVTGEQPFRILVESGTQQTDLGIYPSDAVCGEVERWVSVKTLPIGGLSFQLVPQKTGQRILVLEKKPFSALDKLSSGRFQTVAGQPEIFIPD